MDNKYYNEEDYVEELVDLEIMEETSLNEGLELISQAAAALVEKECIPETLHFYFSYGEYYSDIHLKGYRPITQLERDYKKFQKQDNKARRIKLLEEELERLKNG